jgi:hypothetical protein
MTGPGSQNPGVYRTLKDVVERQPAVVTVQYEPDAIQKRYLRAEIAPDRVTPPTGPERPTLELRWETAPPHEQFRIDYHDPNVSFYCGWHRDEDHPDLGETHFQYRTAEMAEAEREPSSFDHESPARILWTCCERLFEDVLPEYVPDLLED